MAAYEKATLASFKKKLQADGYANLAGAKKSIGKSSFSDEDKVKALRLAEKHFGGSAPAAKPAAKKTVAKATRTAKVAVKSTDKAPKAPKAAKAAKATTKPKTTRSRTKKESVAETPTNMERIATVNCAVGTVQHVLSSMHQARELGAEETEVAKGAQRAQQALMLCVGEVLSVVESGSVSPADVAKAEQIKKVADAVGIGGGNNQPIGAVAAPALPAVPATS